VHFSHLDWNCHGSEAARVLTLKGSGDGFTSAAAWPLEPCIELTDGVYERRQDVSTFGVDLPDLVKRGNRRRRGMERAE
jgi:hypothetical protein